VPFGHRVKPEIFNEALLRATSAALQKTELESRDFRDLSGVARKGDFIYFDPPYQPLSKTSSFTSYTSGSFGEKDQNDLADLYAKLDRRGCLLMLSNSDKPLIRKLYAGFVSTACPPRRMIQLERRQARAGLGGGGPQLRPACESPASLASEVTALARLYTRTGDRGQTQLAADSVWPSARSGWSVWVPWMSFPRASGWRVPCCGSPRRSATRHAWLFRLAASRTSFPAFARIWPRRLGARHASPPAMSRRWSATSMPGPDGCLRFVPSSGPAAARGCLPAPGTHSLPPRRAPGRAPGCPGTAAAPSFPTSTVWPMPCSSQPAMPRSSAAAKTSLPHVGKTNVQVDVDHRVGHAHQHVRAGHDQERNRSTPR